MSNSKAIGKAYIDIEARTSKLEQDLAKAQKDLEKFNGSIRATFKNLTGFDLGNLGKTFLRFGLLLDGVRSGVHALANEVRDLFQNGQALYQAGIISPQAIQTINTVNEAWADMKRTASSTGGEFLANMEKAWRVVASVQATLKSLTPLNPLSLVAGGPTAAQAETYTAPNVDVLAAGKMGEAQYEERRKQLIDEITKAQRAADFASLDRTKQIAETQRRGAEYVAFAEAQLRKDGTQRVQDEVSLLKLKKEGSDLLISSRAAEKAAIETSLGLVRQLEAAREKGTRAELNDTEKLAEIEEKLAKFRATGIFEKAAAGKVTEKAEERALQSALDLENQRNALIDKRRVLQISVGKSLQAAALAEARAGMDRQEEISFLSRRSAYLAEAAQVNGDLTESAQQQVESAQLLAESAKLQSTYLKEDDALWQKRKQLITDANRKALTDAEQLREISREIAAINARRTSQPAVLGEAMTTKQVEDMNRLNTLTEKQITLQQKLRDEWIGVGQTMSSALVNGILEGQQLTQILGNMLKALAEYVIQQAIIRPIGNWIGMGLSSLGSMAFGGATPTGKAVGGPVLGGTTYLIGERGPELFTPASSGTITPNNMVSGKLSGSEGGYTFAPVYNITSGVTRNELMPLLKQVSEQTRASISMDLARGGRRAAQFGG